LRLRISSSAPSTPKSRTATIHSSGICSGVPLTVFTSLPFVTAPVWRVTFVSRSGPSARQTLPVYP
jgi:hypothetical protein